MSLVIRQARASDAAALRQVLWDTFESTWRPQVTEAAAQAFRDEDRPAAFVGEMGHLFWVGGVGGEVAGFVHWEGDFVQALHVKRSFARQGVGRALMDLAEARIAADGHSTARLETDTFNAASQAFYAARGYREADRYTDEEWDSGITTLLLVKPLT